MPCRFCLSHRPRRRGVPGWWELRRRAAGWAAAAAEAAAQEGELRGRVQDFARRLELLQVLLSGLLPATLEDLASDDQARAGCPTCAPSSPTSASCYTPLVSGREEAEMRAGLRRMWPLDSTSSAVSPSIKHIQRVACHSLRYFWPGSDEGPAQHCACLQDLLC